MSEAEGAEGSRKIGRRSWCMSGAKTTETGSGE